MIKIVKFAIRAYNYSFEIGPLNRSKYTKQQIGYFISPSMLQESAHLSLAERAQLFNRRFGEKKISPGSKTSSEAREKLTSLNRKIAVFSI
jgi:hypothetical protein